MIFHTISGSIYDLDIENKQVRRLIGTTLAPRLGKEGEWRKYSKILPDPITVGEPVIIVWTQETPLLDDTKAELAAEGGGFAIPITTTSLVAKIVDENLLS